VPHTFDDIRRLAATEVGLAVLSMTRPDGSVHSSVINAGPFDDPIDGAPSVAAVLRGDARKLDYLRRAGHATITFRRGWDWASTDGPIRLIGPGDPQVDVPDLLRQIFTAAGGTHDDWDEYDRVMAAEGRTALLIRAARIIGNG